ncbi:MAG: DUF3012 domain-containing protein [Elusimicrobia bacterium]|nr:DUF3012 domain-containing protein [Elusimicrobiota bacterium]
MLVNHKSSFKANEESSYTKYCIFL